MSFRSINGRSGRALALGTAFVATIALTLPKPAHAISDGAAVGLGLGALAVGTAVGAASNPYYGYPGYGYGYGYGYSGYPTYYAPPAPAYYPQARSCWDPYYGRYYAC